MEHIHSLKEQLDKVYHSDNNSISQVCEEIAKQTQSKTDEVYVELGKSESIECMWSNLIVGFLWKQIIKLSELFHNKEEETKLKFPDNWNAAAINQYQGRLPTHRGQEGFGRFARP